MIWVAALVSTVGNVIVIVALRQTKQLIDVLCKRVARLEAELKEDVWNGR